jgi:hypothetical protein
MPILSQLNTVRHFSVKSISVLSILCRNLSSYFFRSAFLNKLMRVQCIPSFPCVLDDPLILSSLVYHDNNIWLLLQILKFINTRFFSTSLTYSYSQISSVAPYSKIPPVYMLPSGSETKFHSHTKQNVKFYLR